MSMKNSNDTIGNRTSDLPICVYWGITCNIKSKNIEYILKCFNTHHSQFLLSQDFRDDGVIAYILMGWRCGQKPCWYLASLLGGLQLVLVDSTRLILVLGALLLSEISEETGWGGVADRTAVHMGHGVLSESTDRKQKYKFRKKVLHCPAVSSHWVCQIYSHK